MSDHKEFPSNWRIASDFDPNEHMLSLKGKDYLTVQNRLLWFVRDQRELIMRGLATCSYIIRSEAVEVDTSTGYAHFKTYVRDVLGNEATMYGSETAKDFGDYAEKASTKSLGRALAMLGYGTAAAPEMDEGERVVDTPVERRAARGAPSAPATPPAAPANNTNNTNSAAVSDDEPATPEQQERMRKYREALKIVDKRRAVTDNRLRRGEAEARISHYIEQWKQQHMRPSTPAQNGAR